MSEPPTEPAPPPILTCEWAKEGLGKALEAIDKLGSGTVESYRIGTRSTKKKTIQQAQDNVDWWYQRVRELCPPGTIPDLNLGEDFAVRIIPRDV